MDISLIDSHALPGEVRCVVYWNTMELWMLFPVFIKDEKKFLGSTQGKGR